MWSTLLIAGVVFFILYRLIRFWIFYPWYIQRDLRNQGVPGKYIPILGDLLGHRQAYLADDPLSYANEMTAKYGDYYYSSFGPLPCLNVSDPSLIEDVLKTNARAYHRASLGREILAALLGYENILLAEGDNHTRHRRLVAPVFQQQNINSMISLMVERTSNFLNKWTAAIDDKNQSITLDIHEEMTNLTLDIVTGCVFGTELINDQHVHETISKCVTIATKELEKRMFNMIVILPIINQLPILGKPRIDQAKEEIKHIVQQIVNQRKKGLTKSACKGPDLLDLMLTARGDEKTQSFTDEEVSDEAITFVLAGHETTSTLMTWTLYNLVNNPDVYHQCQAEIDSVLTNDDEITVSTVSCLTYMEAVLKETLRYHQPVPVLVRTATKDNTLVARDGKRIHIKKGTSVVINLHVLHRSEKYWHEPEKFDPLRFNGHHSDILLPFGGGPRTCIGQNFAMLEAKIMLALLVRRFHFELVPGQKHVPDIAVTIRPKYGMWMRISRR
ncbi:unnamed protein product [Rotaria sordida]|uniref:Cytochrome P450 n=2 Tax=Rotaria sordida TaxID=392033 RepID=A0A814GJY4_9BILA|nr:unnamed protein product [Rotaria sordida]